MSKGLHKKKYDELAASEFIRSLSGKRGWHAHQYKKAANQWLQLQHDKQKEKSNTTPQ